MSELDRVFDELSSRRAQQDQARRERQKLAADFLSEFRAGRSADISQPTSSPGSAS
jgi:hypothetical protein